MGCEAAQTLQPDFCWHTAPADFTTAAQPVGDKSPHHKGIYIIRCCSELTNPTALARCFALERPF
jgi:hypothetical protein